MKQEWKAVDTKAITRNIELVFSTSDIDKLDDKAYKFITLHMGFIAHFDLYGFRQVYQDLRSLIKTLQTSEYSRDMDYNITWADQYGSRDDYGRAYHESVAETIRQLVRLARLYRDKIETEFMLKQRMSELSVARDILLKYNIELPEELK